MVGRLSVAHKELEQYRSYHYAIVNDDFERASRMLEAVMLAERNRLTVRGDFIADLLAQRED